MSDLASRSGGPPSRRSREQRAFRLVVGGGVGAAVAVVGAILAIVGTIGWAIPIVAAIVVAICVLLFRRAISG